MIDVQASESRFWEIAAGCLRDGGDRSTMMGSTCLRRDGSFCAAVDRRNGQLLVKLSAERVEELIAEGVGEAFAPAGRVFREWLAVPAEHEASWRAMIDEAWRLVGGAPVHPSRRRRRQDSPSS